MSVVCVILHACEWCLIERDSLLSHLFSKWPCSPSVPSSNPVSLCMCIFMRRKGAALLYVSLNLSMSSLYVITLIHSCCIEGMSATSLLCRIWMVLSYAFSHMRLCLSYLLDYTMDSLSDSLTLSPHLSLWVAFLILLRPLHCTLTQLPPVSLSLFLCTHTCTLHAHMASSSLFLTHTSSPLHSEDKHWTLVCIFACLSPSVFSKTSPAHAACAAPAFSLPAWTSCLLSKPLGHGLHDCPLGGSSACLSPSLLLYLLINTLPFLWVWGTHVSLIYLLSFWTRTLLSLLSSALLLMPHLFWVLAGVTLLYTCISFI